MEKKFELNDQEMAFVSGGEQEDEEVFITTRMYPFVTTTSQLFDECTALKAENPQYKLVVFYIKDPGRPAGNIIVDFYGQL